MRILLDTNIIVRSVAERLPKDAAELLEDTSNTLNYSPISIWEIAIKQKLGKLKLPTEAAQIREGLERSACRELLLNSRHALATASLAEINKDPFDRILVAQSLVEGITLMTTDSILSKYHGDVLLVS